MVELLPTMVDTHIKEQVKRQVPEQVQDQVLVYVAEGVILERQKTKEEMKRMIAKAILQERGNIHAEISSQIQKAIDNHIPSQVDTSVRSYMSGHILHVHPVQSQTTFVPEQQYQLTILMMMLFLRGRIVQSGRRHLSMKHMCLESHRLDKSMKRNEFHQLQKGRPEKIVLSLHKFLAIIFNDDDIEEQTSPDLDGKQKEPGKPKEVIYSNSKIIQVIKTYWELGHEHKFITEIVARRANECIVSIIEPDYKNLNKNDIEDMYLLIMNGKDRKTPQRYPDVPTTSWRISIRSIDSRTIDQSASGKLCDLNSKESWALLEDLTLYDNEIWNDPRDFAKPVKAIALPQDVPSTSDRHLIELENQVQRLMEAHLALTQPTQVNKITTSCEICSGPHDTQYFMENPEQAFVEYASLRTNEAGGKWYTFKPEQNILGDIYNPSWKSHPNLSQSNIEGLVFNFMASQDARLSKFEADFKQQQSEMTNKINTVLKAITNRIAGTLPSDTVKNPKLRTHPVLSARSYPTMDPQCSTQIHSSINIITIHPKQQSDPHDRTEENKEEERDSPENHPDSPTPPDLSVSFIIEKVLKFNSLFESLGLVPPSPNAELVCTNENDEVAYKMPYMIEQYNSLSNLEKERTQEVEYFDIFPTRNELPIKGMHVFIGNFTYVADFMIVKDISSIIDPRLSHVILRRPFIEISNMTHDPPEGVVSFTYENDEVAYKMPHKIEQYNSLSNLEKEHTKSVYLRNEEDKRRGVEYVMSTILGFYRECLELGPNM
ncbi:hypothetical protein Tco_0529904 [Tanacetum coccineum]